MTYRPESQDRELLVPPWLDGQRDALAAMLDQSQAPQALLIHGAPGTGRRYLAFWYAARLLGVPAGRFTPLAECAPGADVEGNLAHPDVLLVQPPPEKDSIVVESVRGLIDFLHLKSHQGGARVVVIWPADSMTTAAANSLLKTLEEPPAGSTIILVASATANLPATVVSRCHRLRISTPARAMARAWLAGESDSAPWDLLLDFSGGAPLRARDLHRAGFAARAEIFAADLQQVRSRREAPVAVARRWADADAEILLSWLYTQAASAVAEALTAPVAHAPVAPRTGRLQNPAKPLNIRPRLARLRLVEEMYRNRSRPINSALQFTALLQGWYGEAAGGD